MEPLYPCAKSLSIMIRLLLLLVTFALAHQTSIDPLCVRNNLVPIGFVSFLVSTKSRDFWQRHQKPAIHGLPV